MIQGLDSIVLIVREKGRSLRFYSGSLGLNVLRQGATSVVLELGDRELILQEVTSRNQPFDDFAEMLRKYPRGLGVVFRFRVQNVEGCYARLKEEGYRIAPPAVDRSMDQKGFEVADPDGYRLLITGQVSE